MSEHMDEEMRKGFCGYQLSWSLSSQFFLGGGVLLLDVALHASVIVVVIVISFTRLYIFSLLSLLVCLYFSLLYLLVCKLYIWLEAINSVKIHPRKEHTCLSYLSIMHFASISSSFYT